jgi:hypothetical protein
MTPVLCVGGNKHGHNSRITSTVYLVAVSYVSHVKKSSGCSIYYQVSHPKLQGCTDLRTTAIISLFSINWLVFTTQTARSCCVARNEHSNKTQENLYWKAVSWLRLFIAGHSPQRPGFDPTPINERFAVARLVLEMVFIYRHFSSLLLVSFHQRSTLIFIYTLPLPEGLMGEAWKNFQKTMLFRNSRITG